MTLNELVCSVCPDQQLTVVKEYTQVNFVGEVCELPAEFPALFQLLVLSWRRGMRLQQSVVS